MAKVYFTPERIAAIIADSKIVRRDNGRTPTIHQLAEKHGTNYKQISSILRTGKPTKSYPKNSNPKPAKIFGSNFKRAVVHGYHSDGLTSKALADEFGIAKSTVSRWGIDS